MHKLGKKMSGNVANSIHKIQLSTGGNDIKNSDLKEEMKKLLTQKLSGEEVESLSESGFKISRPTKATNILVALYKKAASGDMSAIKEVLSMISDKPEATGGEVTIIDDVRD